MMNEGTSRRFNLGISPFFDRARPSERRHAGDDSYLATDKMRALAREAVQKSQVLLKNEDGLLPLSKDANILVVM